MEVIKISVLGIAGVLLGYLMKNTRPEFSGYLTLGMGILILSLAVGKLDYLFASLEKIRSYIPIDSTYMAAILKMIGITYIGQFSSGICKDAGYSAIAGQIELFVSWQLWQSVCRFCWLCWRQFQDFMTLNRAKNERLGRQEKNEKDQFGDFSASVFSLHDTVMCQGSGGDPAEENSGLAEDETSRLMSDLDLDELQEVMDDLLEDRTFSFTEMMGKLMNGEISLDGDTVVAFLREIFIEQFAREKTILLQIFLLVLIAAVFSNFTSMFENGQIGEISFYVIYLLLFVLLMESFQNMSSQLEDSLRAVVTFMQGLAPAYFLAVAASNGATTAAVFYEMVLLLVWLIQWLMITFVLPAA